MAVLDNRRDEIVIRVVYDGPPEAGKTTSMRALAASLGQTSSTPEENARGRTQWFDWMEYVGGRFEGSQIRCQIISVPGQRELGQRRRALVASADVIVYVGDTSRARWPTSLKYLHELRTLREDPTVGIVFQANKRDVADALALARIRAELGEARWDVGVIESVAADGTGIRESFVYAVRLALDRVRDQIARDVLREGSPDHESPEQLLAHLRNLERAEVEDTIERAIEAVTQAPRIESNPASLASKLIQEVLVADRSGPPLPIIPPPPRRALEPPRPPDASVPSGAIWPPVEGRAILIEVSHLDLAPRRHANGDWSAGLGSGWRLVSKSDAHFESLDLGRNALVQWARLHAACTAVMSPHRCIVLAATGDGRWRLWQIVRAEESLRERVERANAAPEPAAVIDSVFQTAQLLVEVNERLATAPVDLPCSLDTIGACDASGMYIGLMPEQPGDAGRPRPTPSALLASELGPILAHDLAGRRTDLGKALANKPTADGVVESLRRMLE